MAGSVAAAAAIGVDWIPASTYVDGEFVVWVEGADWDGEAWAECEAWLEGVSGFSRLEKSTAEDARCMWRCVLCNVRTGGEGLLVMEGKENLIAAGSVGWRVTQTRRIWGKAAKG